MNAFPMAIRARAQAQNVYELFAGKIFHVPKYQRSYAWDDKNLKDFWNDIKESLQLKKEHYWGPITLMATGEEVYCDEEDITFKVYEVVDGQQRIVTLYLFLLALSESGKPAIRKNFIKCGNIYRVVLGGLNEQFLKDLVDGKNPQPTIRTNRLLKNAFEYFKNQISSFGRIDELSKHLQNVTFSLEFVVQDKSLAVKAFETLNDRGKPLTLLDKVKSFLMFYSLRYLNNSLDDKINTTFGNIFTNFDFIKEVGERNGVNYLRSGDFSEDELLRFFYHYFANYAINKYKLPMAYWYDATAVFVFEEFLKKACDHLKNNPQQLNKFAIEFLENFDKFTLAFREIVEKIENDAQFKKLFVFLGLSTRVYPLIISLQTEGLLNQQTLKLVETLDLRVYKVRGTDPRAHLYNEAISKIKTNPDISQIYNNVKSFIDSFMPDTEFRNHLNGNMYNNEATKYILWEFEKSQNPLFNDCDYNLYTILQKEHIFSPQIWETLNLQALGFKDAMEYLWSCNRLGNLTLLEEKINKRIWNKLPQIKASEYQQSSVPGTKRLGYQISNQGFTKADIDRRTTQIIDFCVSRWKY